VLDHMNLLVSDLAKSKAFFSAALAPLGYQVIYDLEHAAGFGIEYPIFWIERDRGTPPAKMHVAFAAPTRAVVNTFYAAAMGAGGRDNGAPGLRPPPYPADYFAAFVLDPDGNNIETVCRRSLSF
jgi:catechol 2,3-dioxygenase-like lactoylglutathione lyase family enzyme